MSPRLAKALAAVVLMGAGLLQAQQPAADPSTLHVYVNRMQIPVLLLDNYRHPTKPIPAERFQVHLQGVPTITPTLVRLEGDDPISIVILLDHSNPKEDWWDRMPQAAAKLAASLHPDDDVDVYGMDGCKLRRFGRDAAVASGEWAAALHDAATETTYKGEKHAVPCPQPISLWDSLGYAASVLQQRPGRRILLAVTSGQHDGSATQMESLRLLLNHQGITLFAVQHGEGTVVAALNSYFLQRRDDSRKDPYSAARIVWGGASLALESELSGGIVLTSSAHALPNTLQQVISLVRGRYIVEFPRPPELTAGPHVITVSVGNTRDFIRPSGISLPTATPEEHSSDPSVMNGSPGDASDPNSVLPQP